MAEGRGRNTWGNALALLACIVLPLALCSSWASGVVGNTDRYVNAVAPLATDPVVKAAVETELGNAAIRVINPPAVVAGTVRSAVDTAVAGVVNSAAFPPAWRNANRFAHQQLLAVLNDDPHSLLDSQGRISLRLNGLLSAAISAAAPSFQGRLDSVPDVSVSIGLVKASDIQKARTAYQVLHALGFWLPVAWLAAVVAALVLAVSRRRVLGILGYGSLITLALLAAALVIGRQLLLNNVASTNRGMVGAIWDHVLNGLYIWAGVAAGAAVVIVVLHWFIGRSRVATGAGA